jgi:molybdenum cofactor cytidylyltransferase
MKGKVSTILLAAGLSARMGEDKLLLDYNGKSLMEHSVDLLNKLPVYERIVVTTEVRQRHIALAHAIRIFINPHPENGLSSSIKIGAAAARGTHFLFLSGDQPLLTRDDIIPLLDAVEMNPERIIFPVIDSKPSSPTLFPSSFREKLLSLCGDYGGRVIRDANKDLWCPIHPASPGIFKDIDNTEDYNKLVHGIC